MQKYVYDETKILTKDELIKELEKINYISPDKEEILNNYDIEQTNLDIDDVEISIKVTSLQKNLDTTFSLFKFSTLSDEENEKLNFDDKVRFLNLLRSNGVSYETCDLAELARVIEILKSSKQTINKLNKKHIDAIVLKEALKELNVDTKDTIIDNILLLINNTIAKMENFLPTVRNKYYDENNNIVSSINVDIPENNSTNLLSFSGEIYEKLNFKTNEEALIYQKEHQICEELDKDITTYIHFLGEEANDNWHKEMHIIKQKNCTMIKYGDHFPICNIARGTSITVDEIDEIISFLKVRTPNNEFLKYIIRELKSLKKVLGERKYVRNQNIIKKESLEKISTIIADSDYGHERNIHFKAKIISSNPLEFKKEKTRSLTL